MFSIRKIKAENRRALNRYVRYGQSLFLEAFRKQANPNFDPKVMENAYVSFYEVVFVDSAKRGYYQIRDNQKDFQLDGIFLSTWRAWIRTWVLENLGLRIEGVNNTTREIIQETLASAVEDGLNTFQIEELLLETVGSKKRAKAIAITEGTKANNMGLRRSADDYESVTGLNVYKLWLHSGRPKEPRISHLLEQNKPIPKNQPFSIETVLLDSPGNPLPGQDSKQVAKQVINCSCTCTYVSERFARRRFPNAF